MRPSVVPRPRGVVLLVLVLPLGVGIVGGVPQFWGLDVAQANDGRRGDVPAGLEPPAVDSCSRPDARLVFAAVARLVATDDHRLDPARRAPLRRIASPSTWMTFPSTAPMTIPSPVSGARRVSAGPRRVQVESFFPFLKMRRRLRAGVFLINPRLVTIARCDGPVDGPSDGSSADPSSTGNIAVMLSPSLSCNTLVNGVPSAAVLASGISSRAEGVHAPAVGEEQHRVRAPTVRRLEHRVAAAHLPGSLRARRAALLREHPRVHALDVPAAGAIRAPPRRGSRGARGALRVESRSSACAVLLLRRRLPRPRPLPEKRRLLRRLRLRGVDRGAPIDAELGPASAFASSATVAITRASSSPSKPVRSSVLAVSSASSALSLSCSKPGQAPQGHGQHSLRLRLAEPERLLLERQLRGLGVRSLADRGDHRVRRGANREVALDDVCPSGRLCRLECLAATLDRVAAETRKTPA